MGAWGTQSFENDDALDWLAALEAEGLPVAGAALAAVEELAPEYSEAPTCSAALAAAEVVAAMRGRPAAALPDEVAAWVARMPEDPGPLVETARRAVDLVAAESELRELWAESPEYETWRATVADLRARLT